MVKKEKPKENKNSAFEIRFKITKKLNTILLEIGKKYGVDKSDYVRSLILNDLRSKEKNKNGN